MSHNLQKETGEKLFKNRAGFLNELSDIKQNSGIHFSALEVLSEQDETAKICRDPKGNPEPVGTNKRSGYKQDRCAGGRMNENRGEIVIYKSEDGQTVIDARLEQDTVWLTQKQMVKLFQTTKQNISLHIKNCFTEGELSPDSTVKEYLIVQQEGKRRIKRFVEYYNLDVIISVGYRVKSLRGTQFRI